jgi:E3 ubiquitin-protein ligase DOA10
MKASSSSNSLISLTIDVEPECIVCLDSGPNAQGEYVMNPLTLRICGCRFPVHPKCWAEWVRARNMCPICRRQIMVYPVQAQRQVQVQVPVLVLADTDDNAVIKTRVFFLFCVLLLVAIIIVLYFVYGN